jgi:hypothetical protein
MPSTRAFSWSDSSQRSDISRPSGPVIAYQSGGPSSGVNTRLASAGACARQSRNPSSHQSLKRSSQSRWCGKLICTCTCSLDATRPWKAQERSRMRWISAWFSSSTGQRNSRPTR